MMDVVGEKGAQRGMRVAVLGVGLIGGSIALAARRRTAAYVVGYDPDAGALSRAVELGVIDEPALKPADAVRDAEVVFVATPVGVAVEAARMALEVAGEDCVVSDVGSTKRAIVAAVSDPRFVGGHPLAGAETAGVEHARKDLFDGATWYLTPPAGAAWQAVGASSSAHATPPPPVDSAPWAVERLRGLIGRFGAKPVAIDPNSHDLLMANVSHLPHVLANLLVTQALGAVESDGMTAGEGDLDAGPSFRDATRVAGANTAIWTDIYMSNSDLLVEAIGQMLVQLQDIRDTLSVEDSKALSAWNERARAAREQLRRAGLVPGS
jgi:prephenate dehydrogenase